MGSPTARVIPKRRTVLRAPPRQAMSSMQDFVGGRSALSRRIREARRIADDHPRHAASQVALLRALNQRGSTADMEGVVARVENGSFAINDAGMREYYRSLSQLGMADRAIGGTAVNNSMNASSPTVSHSLGVPPGAYSGASAAGLQQTVHHYHHHQTAAAAGMAGYPTAPAMASSMAPGGASMVGAGGGAVAQGGAAGGEGAVVASNSPLGSSANPLYTMNTATTSSTLINNVFRLITTALVCALIWYGFTKISGQTSQISSMIKGFKVKQAENVEVRFDDVKGCEEAVDELRDIVSFLKDPQPFLDMGAKMPSGVLLYGPPGTGKTLLARAVAGEAGVPFLFASGSEFEEMLVGLGSKRVRLLFERAREMAPCIVFIDEIDALAGKRGISEGSAHRQSVNQLLTEMDGFQSDEGVIVMCASNLLKAIDPALLRPGRFDRKVKLGRPDLKGRMSLLELYSQGKPMAKDVDLAVLARGTPGLTGADIQNLLNLAAIQAATEGCDKITAAHLNEARDRQLMGAERKSHGLTPAVQRKTAIHEAGHALVAVLTEGADPIHKATIMPRGMALGMVQQLPKDDVVSITRQQLLARLDIMMGGRIAEELGYGPDGISTGASNDFEQATRLARGMVLHYGMSKRLGVMSVDEDKMDKLSPQTRQIIDEDVQELLDASYARAKKLLTDNRTDLDRLAEVLFDRETLDQKDILRIIHEGAGVDDFEDILKPKLNPVGPGSHGTRSSSDDGDSGDKVKLGLGVSTSGKFEDNQHES